MVSCGCGDEARGSLFRRESEEGSPTESRRLLTPRDLDVSSLLQEDSNAGNELGAQAALRRQLQGLQNEMREEVLNAVKNNQMLKDQVRMYVEDPNAMVQQRTPNGYHFCMHQIGDAAECARRYGTPYVSSARANPYEEPTGTWLPADNRPPPHNGPQHPHNLHYQQHQHYGQDAPQTPNNYGPY